MLSSSVHSLYPFELLSKTRRIDKWGSRGKGRDTIWKLIALFCMNRSANSIKCTRRDHVDHREQVSRTIDVISGLIRDYRYCTRMYKHSSYSLRYSFPLLLIKINESIAYVILRQISNSFEILNMDTPNQLGALIKTICASHESWIILFYNDGIGNAFSNLSIYISEVSKNIQYFPFFGDKIVHSV